jgi:tetratricopeptide (TPR) repeat protein
MSEMIASANQEALGSEAERLERAEHLRSNHEKAQREVRLAAYQDGIEKRYPHWFIRVRENIVAGRNREALESLNDHIEDPSAWSAIDRDIKAYILHAQGVAAYRTGANLEAREASRQALKEARNSNGVSTLMQAWAYNIQGLSAMRLWDTDHAFDCFDNARKLDRSVDGTYYNAMCCASVLQSEDQVGFWSGQYVGSCHLFAVSDIEDVISRVPIDRDLVFFRQLPIMKEFVDRLTSEVQSRKQPKES